MAMLWQPFTVVSSKAHGIDVHAFMFNAVRLWLVKNDRKCSASTVFCIVVAATQTSPKVPVRVPIKVQVQAHDHHLADIDPCLACTSYVDISGLLGPTDRNATQQVRIHRMTLTLGHPR